ncbi:MAG: hypothetical protein RLZZ303_2253 [Candidatus Hydrogenedentota bacterium]
MDELQHGFHIAHRLGILAVNLAIFAGVIELVRRGHLKERYALLWLGVSGAGLLLGLFPNSIVLASDFFGFQYLTTVFVVSFLFLMGLVLAFSVILSRLSERHRTLTQEVALLEERLRQLERKP